MPLQLQNPEGFINQVDETCPNSTGKKNKIKKKSRFAGNLHGSVRYAANGKVFTGISVSIPSQVSFKKLN